MDDDKHDYDASDSQHLLETEDTHEAIGFRKHSENLNASNDRTKKWLAVAILILGIACIGLAMALFDAKRSAGDKLIATPVPSSKRFYRPSGANADARQCQCRSSHSRKTPGFPVLQIRRMTKPGTC